MGILGSFRRRVTDDAILAAVTSAFEGTPLSTCDVGAVVDLTRQAMHPRLEALAARGLVVRVDNYRGNAPGWMPVGATAPEVGRNARRVGTSTVAELVSTVRRLVEQGITATCAVLSDVLGWSRVWVRAVVCAAVALGQLFRGGLRNAEVYPVAEAAVEATAQVAARRGFGATARDAASWMLARARAAVPSITLAGFTRLVEACKTRVTSAVGAGILLDARAVVAAEVCQ